MAEIIDQIDSNTMSVVIRKPKILFFVNKSSRILGRENFSVNQSREKLEAEITNLKNFFRSRGFHGFDPIEGICKSDVSTGDLISEILEDCAKSETLGNYDSLIVCFLGFGDLKRCMYVDDDKVDLPELTNPFRSHVCEGLSRKPKLFLIQTYSGIEERSCPQARAVKEPPSYDADLFVLSVILPHDWTGPSMVSELNSSGANTVVSDFVRQLEEAIANHGDDWARKPIVRCENKLQPGGVKFPN